MIRADINLTMDDLLQMFMFEFKDGYTLAKLERALQDLLPGNYHLIKFADPDVVTGDRVLAMTIEFDSEEDRVLFNLRWDYVRS